MPTDIAMLVSPMRLAIFMCVACVICACTKEVPPRSVTEFVENPILLEATMVRCAQNRAQTKYDAECVNAREAVNKIAAIRDQEQRAELEAQSEQKRQALRRTQAAAAEARRRAAEAQRLREEAAYLGQFDTVPPTEDGTAGNGSTSVPTPAPSANAPGAQLAPADPVPANDSAGTAAPATETPADLDAIREELKRRQDPPQ